MPIEKYGKTPIFSGKQHFYSYFQNPSENSEELFEWLLKTGFTVYIQPISDRPMEFSIDATYNKGRMVHCIYFGVTGYEFPKILYEFLSLKIEFVLRI